jgi:amidase
MPNAKEIPKREVPKGAFHLLGFASLEIIWCLNIGVWNFATQRLRSAVFLLMVAATSRAAFPFAEATIDDLQRQMAEGKLSARTLTAAYLERIAAVDRAGPKLNAIIELNPDALMIADLCDAERRAGKVRGPLHGIPILIKDNIATADQMETTAGSLALMGAKPPRDAHIVTRLRDAGAVILGKTNLSEWANFRGSSSTSGWSGRGGQTRNPYALDRNPSGSSSGSAVAVSANLCVAAIGTETNGSIVSPASVCGVVGIKPTVGLVSRAGIIPIAASLDTAGPMARTVRDAAIVLQALAGRDERDAATAELPADLGLDFAAALKPGALRGARVGVLRGPFGFRPWLDAIFTVAVSSLRDAGAEIIDLGEYAGLRQMNPASFEVMQYEFKDGLNAYLAELGSASKIKTLADVIAFNQAHAKEELGIFGQEILLQTQGKGPLTDKAYRDARATCIRISRTDGIDGMMNQHRLDAIVSLTTGPASVGDPIYGGASASTGGSSGLAAVAGYPSVTLPAAEVRGLPMGISFFGRAWSESKLLALAADFEARTRMRREPKHLPTIAGQ